MVEAVITRGEMAAERLAFALPFMKYPDPEDMMAEEPSNDLGLAEGSHIKIDSTLFREVDQQRIGRVAGDVSLGP